MLERAYAFFYKQWLKTVRGWAESAWITVYPLVALFTAGFFLQFVKGDPTAVVYLIGGTFAWNFYNLCQKGVTYGLLYDVWDHCLKHSMTSTATVFDFVLGNAAFGFVTALFSFAVSDVLSIIFFHFDMLSAGPVLFVSFLIILLYSIAEALVINSLVVLKGYQFVSLTWILTGIVMVLSAVYYPVEVLPPLVQPISAILPTTYAIEAFRNAMLGKEFVSDAATGLVLSIIYALASMALFSYAIKRSKQTGFLSKL